MRVLLSFLERAKLFLRKENLLGLEESLGLGPSGTWDSSAGACVLELFGATSGHDHLLLPLLLFHRFLHFTSVSRDTESSQDICLLFIVCSLLHCRDALDSRLWSVCGEDIQVLASFCQISSTECWSKEVIEKKEA